MMYSDTICMVEMNPYPKFLNTQVSRGIYRGCSQKDSQRNTEFVLIFAES